MVKVTRIDSYKYELNIKGTIISVSALSESQAKDSALVQLVEKLNEKKVDINSKLKRFICIKVKSDKTYEMIDRDDLNKVSARFIYDWKEKYFIKGNPDDVERSKLLKSMNTANDLLNKEK